MSKLHNVRGRITYISSHAKQENLYAVYETTDCHYWTELARFNQQEFLKSGTKGECIEARELIIALPKSFPDLINLLIGDDKNKLQVFDKNGLYLATKKIGKNNPKAEQIKTDNEVRMMWNHDVDRALVSQVPEDEIRQIKNEFITDRIRGSIKVWGNCPKLLANIIRGATTRLALLIHDVLTAAKELKNNLYHEALEKGYGSRAVIKTEDTADVVTIPAKEVIIEPEPPSVTLSSIVPETKIAEQPKPQMPSRPIMPPEAAAFLRLQKVKVTLDKHNNLIFEAESERTKLEIELSDLKGLARLTKKKELENRIATKTEEIRTLKAGLSGIVRQHGFATVQDFYTAFYTAQRAIDAYQKECAKWDETYGEKDTPKAETMHEKIKRYQEKADRQNASHTYQSWDKGAG